ncbi:3-deoxy-manno-octulosonate cytidylyltransferase [Thalassobius sp. I31.1]|uniref:3-deoxy-manno-octulosonate cytidylyltransferase n=1 Tax=Thalassobius sp. I31.1 TaxID=2109912 RepID=UPI000D1A73D7|nr:3-deoxy-manno-octulosonate cytidylyltransferase [Thalassobius sp. I31.1]
MSVLIVVPARYASTRYPGKPLVEIQGATGEKKTLIQRSWEAAKSVSGVARVVVATDDDRIRTAAEAFGAEVVMTPESSRNGTERTAAALDTLGAEADQYEIVVNFQGDAPLTPSWFVEDLIAALRANSDDMMATPVLRTSEEALAGFRRDRSEGRVGGTTALMNRHGHAIYFSKEVLPYGGDAGPEAKAPVFHHVGVYAFRPEVLQKYLSWPEAVLEKTEGLEQLRFVENGERITCVEVDGRGKHFWELNNPEDLPVIEAVLADEKVA